MQLQEHGKKVGEILASKGVVGYYGVDFLVKKSDADNVEVFALEINLRQGGTTHPYFSMKFLTGMLHHY